ncbi:MAG: S1/P1 nuclease [Acidobacteriota bacterium]
MTKAYRLIGSMLVLIFVLSAPANAWNARGHMMVAAVAYQKLTQRAKDRVDALLMLNPDRDNWLDLIPAGTSAALKKKMIFMIAATWSDRIKGDPDYHTDGTHGGNRPPTDGTANRNIGYDDLARHKYWHFVDVPFTQDGTTLPPIITPNAQTQITAFRAVLASTTSSDPLKSYDLSWLLHLIGDVHQPLHCTARVSATKPEGDDGGNAVKLSSPANLHTFWDGVLGGGNAPSTAANAATALTNAPTGPANNLNVQNWVDESFAIAKRDVYINPPIGPGTGQFTLTPAYKTKAKGIAQKRIALAGARLAKILNDELK